MEIYDIKVLQNDPKELGRIVSNLQYVLNNCNVKRLVDFLQTLRV